MPPSFDQSPPSIFLLPSLPSSVSFSSNAPPVENPLYVCYDSSPSPASLMDRSTSRLTAPSSFHVQIDLSLRSVSTLTFLLLLPQHFQTVRHFQSVSGREGPFTLFFFFYLIRWFNEGKLKSPAWFYCPLKRNQNFLKFFSRNEEHKELNFLETTRLCSGFSHTLTTPLQELQCECVCV